MIRVAIVDEDLVACYALTRLLSAEPDVQVVATMAGPAGLVCLAVDRIDVLICDPFPVGVPSWLDAVREVAVRVPVLVVSGSANHTEVSAAVQAGARGYVPKRAGAGTFAPAVRSVATGGMYLLGRISGPAPVTTRAGVAGSVRGLLSDREQEALAYISSGFTHQQTARRMGVSKATVDTYVARIRTKLRIGNKAELALAALRHVEPRHRLTAALTGHQPPAAVAVA